MPFDISFRTQKRAKVIMITTLKYLKPLIVAKQFQILLNEIFKIRIFSNPLNFFHFYVIYFYTQGTSSSKNTPRIGILAHLKRPLKTVSSGTYFRVFAKPDFNSYVDPHKGTCNLTKLVIRCIYGPGYFKNIFRTTFYQTTAVGRYHI